jgi:hypothetical protein
MGDAAHVWKDEDLREHQNVWQPETEEGKKGVMEHINQRKAAS